MKTLWKNMCAVSAKRTLYWFLCWSILSNEANVNSAVNCGVKLNKTTKWNGGFLQIHWMQFENHAFCHAIKISWAIPRASLAQTLEQIKKLYTKQRHFRWEVFNWKQEQIEVDDFQMERMESKHKHGERQKDKRKNVAKVFCSTKKKKKWWRIFH